jgi:CRISPR/Cas system Type II protein with McrA/HNH and RuvC-like nuclease domain
MPAPTPGFVKNMIGRSFKELVDPSPTKKDKRRIWEFFASKCAYCGKELDKNKKEGHIDHLVSSSVGGPNHVSNRVLSCASCNEEEKLDKDWRGFLLAKVADKQLAETRKSKIVEWQKQNAFIGVRKALMKEIDSAIHAVVNVYDQKVRHIRKLLGMTCPPRTGPLDTTVGQGQKTRRSSINAKIRHREGVA